MTKAMPEKPKGKPYINKGFKALSRIIPLLVQIDFPSDILNRIPGTLCIHNLFDLESTSETPVAPCKEVPHFRVRVVFRLQGLENEEGGFVEGREGW